MCKQVIWAIDGSSWSDAVVASARAVLEVEPEPIDVRIDSGRVRASAVHFLLTKHLCDCDALIGAGRDEVPATEPQADAWLSWLRQLPEHAPHLRRLALLHTWSGEPLRPTRASGTTIDRVDEALLRGLEQGALLTIDYR